MGLDRMIALVLDHGVLAVIPIAIAVAIITAAYYGAKVTATAFAKPAAKRMSLVLSNWLVLSAAFVMSRWTPRLAETIREQLDWLEHFHEDGTVGLRLLSHATTCAVRMRATALAREAVAVERRAAAGADSASDVAQAEPSDTASPNSATREVVINVTAASRNNRRDLSSYFDVASFSARFTDSFGAPWSDLVRSQVRATGLADYFNAKLPKFGVMDLLPGIDVSQLLPKVEMPQLVDSLKVAPPIFGEAQEKMTQLSKAVLETESVRAVQQANELAKRSESLRAATRIGDALNTEAVRALRSHNELGNSEMMRTLRRCQEINTGEVARVLRRYNELGARAGRAARAIEQGAPLDEPGDDDDEA